MTRILKNTLSTEQIESLEKRIVEAANAGHDEDAWEAAQTLLRAQRRQQEAAGCLTRIVHDRHLPIERAADVLAAVFDAHADDEYLLSCVGDALEGARDIDRLNSAPPEHPVFLRVVERLAEVAKNVTGDKREEKVLFALATGARMLARQRDDLADACCRRLIELDPEYSAYHYNYGLLLKTRGRFAEGVVANQTAASLLDEPAENYEWNLGICATGAGEGEVALDVWKRMEQKIEMGRFGLPEGGYPQCKVQLAQRPLAERNADSDDPGLEETIWIERLSPCHGIVRSVLYQNLGVDYGDVVLIDGAPVTYHTYGERKIAVFPHLATLVHRHYRFFDFAGTQDESGRLADASADLDGDAIVYSHTENYRNLCATCWQNADLDHAHHETFEKHVVSGRVAAPADVDPAHLLAQLDSAVADRQPCRLFVPDLCEAVGLAERAAVERRRFDMLKNS